MSFGGRALPRLRCGSLLELKRSLDLLAVVGGRNKGMGKESERTETVEGMEGRQVEVFKCLRLQES